MIVHRLEESNNNKEKTQFFGKKVVCHSFLFQSDISIVHNIWETAH